MKVNERSVVIILAGILLLIMILCFCSVNASADEKVGLKANTSEAEINYKSDIKDVLGDHYIRNAGVTMLKKSYDGVNIYYSVTIHISSYKNIDNQEKEELMNELNSLNIAVENARVEFSFS